jgi:signal transduction histidine kinase
MDLTERKKLERKLVEEQVARQRQITKATIEGQEAERREIGKELHDNIGQQLTTIKLFLDLAKSTADDATYDMVGMALKAVSDVINEVRAISRSLIPPTLQDLGLVESIHELIDSFTLTLTTDIEFIYEEIDEEILPDNYQLTLYRIVQEQLNNIVKYADAGKVTITLHSNAQNTELEVMDDGRGFDIRTLKKGLGLVNIRNRAEILGGKMELITSPGKGCLLKVLLPNVRPAIGDRIVAAD